MNVLIDLEIVGRILTHFVVNSRYLHQRNRRGVVKQGLLISQFCHIFSHFPLFRENTELVTFKRFLSKDSFSFRMTSKLSPPTTSLKDIIEQEQSQALFDVNTVNEVGARDTYLVS